MAAQIRVLVRRWAAVLASFALACVVMQPALAAEVSQQSPKAKSAKPTKSV